MTSYYVRLFGSRVIATVYPRILKYYSFFNRNLRSLVLYVLDHTHMSFYDAISTTPSIYISP